MDAFHTQKAKDMYLRLPESKPQAQELLEKTTPEDTATQVEFRKLRNELQEEGWFERDMVHEYKLLAIWASLVVGAALTAHSIPLLSTVLLGLSMTNAGWLGHDYVHGVDDFSMKMRNFAALAAGLDPIWWSDKHNKHHALSKYIIDICVVCVVVLVVVLLFILYSLVILSTIYTRQPMKWESMRILLPTPFSINGLLLPKTIRLYERFNIGYSTFHFHFSLPFGESIPSRLPLMPWNRNVPMPNPNSTR